MKCPNRSLTFLQSQEGRQALLGFTSLATRKHSRTVGIEPGIEIEVCDV